MWAVHVLVIVDTTSDPAGCLFASATPCHLLHARLATLYTSLKYDACVSGPCRCLWPMHVADACGPGPGRVAIREMSSAKGVQLDSTSSIENEPGFGVGRLALRVAWEHPEAYNVVTINDIAAAESIAYLIQYDSIHGSWKCDVECDDSGIITITEGDRTQKIKFTQEKDLSKVRIVQLFKTMRGIARYAGCRNMRLCALQQCFQRSSVRWVVAAVSGYFGSC